MLGVARARRRRADAGRRPLAARQPGAGRLLVRALGRQPRLRDGRGRAGAGRRRRRRCPIRAIRRAVSWLEQSPERRRRLGRGLPLLRRSGLDRPRREHRLADRLGAAGARRRRRAGFRRPRAGASTGCSSTSAPDGGWDEPITTPAPASRLTSTSTTTCTGCLPDHGAGALHAMTAAAEPPTVSRAARPASRCWRRPARRTSRSPARSSGAGARATCWRSTASRGWSTTSATRPPATAARCSTWSRWSSSGVFAEAAAAPQHPLMRRSP